MVIEYVADGKLLRAADQEEHFLEDIAVNGHDIDEKGSMRGSEERRTKRTSSVTRCDEDHHEMYHSWAGIGMLRHELQTNIFWTISK